MLVRLEPATPRSRDTHSTKEPLRSLQDQFEILYTLRSSTLSFWLKSNQILILLNIAYQFIQ